MPQIKQNPCCCTSLRTGSLFIGVSEIIGNVLSTLVASLGLIGVAYVYTFPIEDKSESANMQTQVFGTLVVLTLSIILSLIGFILGIVLVSGVTKESPRTLKAYLILKILFLFAIIAMAVTCVYTAAKSYLVIETLIDAEFSLPLKNLQSQFGSNSLIVRQLIQFSHGLTLILYIGNILSCVCSTYTIFVVRAHLKELKGKMAVVSVPYATFDCGRQLSHANPGYLDYDNFAHY